MNLTCPACGAPFSADDVHVDAGIANCRVCRGVLDLRARDRPLQRPQPPRFRVDEGDGRLRIDWRWFTASKLLFIPFAVVWWLFLANWYGHALAHPDQLFPIVFPLVHVGAGLFVAYLAITNLVNRTQISVDADHVTVRHGPLPWRGNRKLVRGTLVQLFCRRDTGNKGAISYAVVAIDLVGKRVDLVRGLVHEDEARWLEETLERRLGIANRPVVGELA